MKDITFIPEKFHHVRLGFDQTIENKCTPHYPNYEIYLDNEIKINIPQKIIFERPVSELTPVIPVCGAYLISVRRGLKYADLSAEMLYIRKVTTETWYSGEIINFALKYEHPALLPDHEELERERQERVKAAQQYSDDELNEGQYAGSAFNLNLMEYVDIPLMSGIYEVYYSASGLESNRATVEIIVNE